MELPTSLSMPLYEAPRLVIERQPKKRGYRFRYKSEGETHGGIPGEADANSGNKKFYPTIKILGYSGPAKIIVTLVTAKKPYHLHAHSMIVNREPMKGYCIFPMNGSSNTLELKNIAIQHAVKDRLMDTLMDRILQNRFIQQFGWNSALKPGEKMLQDVDYYTKILEDKDESNTFVDRTTAKAIAGAELKELQKQAKQLCKTMAMNSCRLCFQAFLMDGKGKYTQVLESVVSDEIIDGKTKEGATLKIVRLSAVTSSVGGNDEVWLLADKLNADDIEVRFFKCDAEGALEWEALGEFAKSDVFKQIYCEQFNKFSVMYQFKEEKYFNSQTQNINKWDPQWHIYKSGPQALQVFLELRSERQAVLIFKTPPYKDVNIRHPIKVFLQLRRRRDKSCTSEPTAFTYKPKRYDAYNLHEKRKKNIPKNFLENKFPKKSNIDFSMANTLMQMVNPGQQMNTNQNKLGTNQVSVAFGGIGGTTEGAVLTSTQGNSFTPNHGRSLASDHGGLLPSDHGGSLAANQTNLPAFMMGNSGLSVNSLSLNPTNDPTLLSTAFNPPSLLTSQQQHNLHHQQQQQQQQSSVNIENLGGYAVTDSFMNEILGSNPEIKEEPEDNPTNGDVLSMYQPTSSTVSSYFGNFPNDLSNFIGNGGGGHNVLWDQQDTSAFEFDIKKMEE